MNNTDKQYLDALSYILDNGAIKTDRTGTGTISIFDYSMKFNMKEGFPLLTSKKMFLKGIITELIWFLNGNTNIKYLIDNNCHIWDGDAYKNYEKTFRFQKKMQSGDSDVSGPEWNILTKEEFIEKIKTDDNFSKKWGELGPVYGKQWRDWNGRKELVEIGGSHFGGSFGGPIMKKGGKLEETYIKGIDQISNLINDLKTNPDSRRLIVSAWNVDKIEEMTLPPCHFVFQCYTYEMTELERIKEWCDSLGKSEYYGVDMDTKKLDDINFPKRKLDLKWTMRSTDFFLGFPFNLASYGMLLHLISKEVNMIPNNLIFSGGDCHIYLNHIDQCKKQISQKTYDLPSIWINPDKSIFDIDISDIKINGYKSSEAIKGELSN